jgi:O-antigen ligase
MLGLIYLYPKVMLRVSSLTVPLLLLLVIGGGLLSNQLSWAQARFNSDETALGRLPLMYAAYRMFEAKPIVGWGYGNYDRYDHQFQERVFDLVNPNKDLTSHNAYLTLLSEQGITGTFLFLFPLFWWFAKTLKVLHKMPEEGFWSRKLIIIFWLVIMATIVVNNFADIDVVFNLGLWWVMLALIANMVQEYSEPIKAHPKLASMGLQYKH